MAKIKKSISLSKILGLVILILIGIGSIFNKNLVGKKTNLEYEVKQLDYDYEYNKKEIISYWENDVFFAKIYFKQNCAQKIKTVDYSLNVENLVLKYSLDNPKYLAKCFLPIELTYKITNLPKKDYKITVNNIK